MSLAIDEPDAWAETDWVMRLAQRLGTGHTLIPAERPAEDLLATLAATAEPPAADTDLFLSPFAAQVRRPGVRTVLLDWGVDPSGHELSRDQALLPGRAGTDLPGPGGRGSAVPVPGLALARQRRARAGTQTVAATLPVLPRRPSRLLAWFAPTSPWPTSPSRRALTA